MNFEEYASMLNDYNELLESIEEQQKDTISFTEWLELEQRKQVVMLHRDEIELEARKVGFYEKSTK